MLTGHVLLMVAAMFFAGIAWFCASKSRQHAKEARELCSALSSERSLIAQLDVANTRNTETLRRLSGMVYKRKQEAESSAGDPSPDTPQGRAELKAQLRERYGITPKRAK
jgi:high-affinity Fe2+/Pb2+ permease